MCGLKHWSVGVGLGIVFVLMPAFGETIQKEKNTMSSDSLEQRGKKLRAEVENIFRSLKATNSLKPMGQGRNFVTQAVIKYIPVGTSFDDAEAILRAAGCDVSPRSYEKLVGNQFYKSNVLGTLTLPGNFLSSTKFSISLIPKSPGDYSVVNEAVAEIIVMPM